MQASLPSRVAREAVNAEELKLQINAAYIAGLPQVSTYTLVGFCVAVACQTGIVCTSCCAMLAVVVHPSLPHVTRSSPALCIRS
jgi:hypothetical protein